MKIPRIYKCSRRSALSDHKRFRVPIMKGDVMSIVLLLRLVMLCVAVTLKSKLKGT